MMVCRDTARRVLKITQIRYAFVGAQRAAPLIEIIEFLGVARYTPTFTSYLCRQNGVFNPATRKTGVENPWFFYLTNGACLDFAIILARKIKF